MTAVLIDANVLIDVFTEDERWFEWSSLALEEAAETSPLVINPVVYAEASMRFSRIEEFEAALPPSFVAREAIPFEAAFLAGKAFTTYRNRGGAKTTTLPDFFIGAHAAVAGYRLLTRDPKVYRAYFPKVALIAP
ncbi:MAG: type II toxin-antitoxin system VapC family toxin [Parvularculaceae bacterium]